ncbi:MAG: addiction module antidote protein, HigA family [Gammaproteobacteria bacterium RIFCSPHIGHO2_12_FULL_45_12]|nr:MAG: addiction module antidote protein, HigA family [Gammaproteobacteria bacterium RIFCSPHIGHO2_12_FULL_45_12]
MSLKNILPTHPGEILEEEFLKPMEISRYKLAKDICVPQTRISKIIKGERGITPDTALRLAQYFNMTAEFWMNLQANDDLKIARKKTGKAIEKEVRQIG